MPKHRPGTMWYATATKAVAHGAPVIENGVAGVAVKQGIPPLDSTLATRDDIAIGEKFAVISKGEVEVPTVAGFAKGDRIYIIAATNVLTKTSTGNVKFGVVTTVAGERGLATGRVRIDLDKKDTF